MFAPKDHLNYRYFDKRSAYVAELYKQLRDAHPYTKTEEIGGCKGKDVPKRRVTRSANKAKSANHLPGDIDEGGIRPYFFLQAWQGDLRRPIIVVKCLIPRNPDWKQSVSVPTEETHRLTSWTIRIFPVPAANTFRENRLTPCSNCVRFCTTSATPAHLVDELEKHEHAENQLPPTPMYNGALLEDIR